MTANTSNKIHALYSVILAALLILNFAYLLNYIFFDYRMEIHSDSAVKVLIAKEIFDTGNYFPTDWNYVNNDLFILFGHTFIIPLLAFMPPGFAAHAISGAISASIILALIWLVSRLLSMSALTGLACVTIFCSGISPFMSENLFGQVSYGAVLYHTLGIIASSLLWLDKKGSKAVPFLVIAAAIVGLTFWHNPQRALVAQGYPVVAAALSLAFFCRTRDQAGAGERKISILVIAILTGAVAGTLAHLATLQKVNSVFGASDATWLTFEQAIRNIGYTLQGVLGILGGLPAEGGTVTSTGGAFAAIRIIGALAFIAVAVAAWRHLLVRGSRSQHFFAAFILHSAVPVLLLQIFTTLPDMNDPIQSSRYLVPVVALSVIAMLSHWEGLKPASYLGALTFVALLPLATTGPLSAAVPALASHQAFGQTNQYASDRLEVLAFMKSNNLRYGYASYWNASVYSVLSDGETLVRPIHINSLSPFRHLSSDRWYSETSWAGPSFILLSSNELEYFDESHLIAHGYKPEKRLKIANYTILTFTENISGRLPGWNTSIEEPTSIPITQKSHRQVGTYLEIDGKGVLQAGIGQSGALHYGPYWLLRKGDYQAEFLITLPDLNKGGARLDVATTTTDTKILASGDAVSTGVTTLNFHNSTRQPLEFRVWVDGSSTVQLRGITITEKSNVAINPH
ncbi:hypothetical protein FE840_018825 (plasmid) [Peteryoungia desertarenae]|uniref:Glycosyltransferase RgtA/B/C/D-like domain-containing protein n=1 Tax=Peteryoungia desertarenae TaxID=1813451 RepID=A0ABX6QT69_9HYPH|nr:hypothetical protein [Peteryoungia desertarenae]QLF71694.1 hypothetical protein FE840_018825 [Peteryoungia desertarenae]